MRRMLSVVALTLLGVLVGAPAAVACGFLVSPNGAVDLARTTTFVVWEDGIEHYITNFEFAGDAESFGSITPLPAEPTDVRRAGDWTLQRLAQEVSPLRDFLLFAPFAATAADEAVEVILETKVDSLDIVVLKGGGQAVLDWVNDNGFNLPEGPETDHMLDFYGSRSPYFMATKFDAAAAADDGFVSGNSIPIQVTIPTDRPWVPLHILHGAKADTEIIEADVFMLTPRRPQLLYGEGMTINRSEWASDELLDDLRSDVDMDWVPHGAWFTHLELRANAEDLVYDLAVSIDEAPPSFRDAGFAPIGEGDHALVPIASSDSDETAPDAVDLTLSHEHPVTDSPGLWLGLAAVVGWLAGWLGSRTRRSA